MATILNILSPQLDCAFRSVQTCSEDNLLDAVSSKATEYLSPLPDNIDCKVTKHNITLAKCVFVIISVGITSS